MTGKLLLAVNPRAGKSAAKRRLLELVELLTDGGCEVTVLPTKPGEKTPERISALLKSGRFDFVAACGGDGTLHLAVDGVLRSGTKLPIGYLPFGSTNDFAASLGIPTDWRKAAEALLRAEPVPHDVGLFNGRPFTYIACCGAFAETSFHTSQSLKNLLGHTAYLFSALPALSELHPLSLDVRSDDGDFAGPFLFCAVANTRSVAGMVKLGGSQVNFQDGKFELLLVRYPANLKDAGRLTAKLLNGEIDDPLLLLRHVTSCKVTAQGPYAWSLDGEDGGKEPMCTIHVEKCAVAVLKNEKTS